METNHCLIDSDVTVLGDSKNLVNKILELDKLCYPDYLQGTFNSIQDRLSKNRESLVFAYEEDKLLGYICFYPISEDLIDSIYESNEIYDDNITSENILRFGDEQTYNLFIISVVVNPSYQGSNIIKLLSDKFIKVLNELNKSNKINKLIAISVSRKGENFLEKLNFSKVQELDNCYNLYECNFNSLKQNI